MALYECDCSVVPSMKVAPMDPISSEKPPIVDERWLQQWISFGMLELAVYLTNHAAFHSYCEHREPRPSA